MANEVEKAVQVEAQAFADLPRGERKLKQGTLSPAVRAAARKIIEARRGIVDRTEDGVPVYSEDEIIRQATRKAAKIEENKARNKALAGQIKELTNTLSETYGDAAVKKLEKALAAND